MILSCWTDVDIEADGNGGVGAGPVSRALDADPEPDGALILLFVPFGLRLGVAGIDTAPFARGVVHVLLDDWFSKTQSLAPVVLVVVLLDDKVFGIIIPSVSVSDPRLPAECPCPCTSRPSTRLVCVETDGRALRLVIRVDLGDSGEGVIEIASSGGTSRSFCELER